MQWAAAAALRGGVEDIGAEATAGAGNISACAAK
jgi:hypothetical protein